MTDISQIDLNVTLGATTQENGCLFKVWAPKTSRLFLELISQQTSSTFEMRQDQDGVFSVHIESIEENQQYYYRFPSQKRLPDPASRHQPKGLHGPSQVAATFPWQDNAWEGLDLENYVIYQIHVAHYTAAGTFTAIIPKLKDLVKLGITAIEILPNTEFTFLPFTLWQDEGGPDALKTLINACHQHEIAVIIPISYLVCLPPEYDILTHYGPYFSSKYLLNQQQVFNFDDAHSHQVRRYLLENALHWFIEYHVDALRIDGIDAILDQSATHFLHDMSNHIHALGKKLGRELYLFANSEANDTRLLLPQFKGGFEFDSQWNHDFHYALYAMLTRDHENHYQDFGKFNDFIKSYKEGFVFSGQYSSYRKKNHGRPSRSIQGHQFIIFLQNYVHIKSRKLQDRIAQHLEIAPLKLAAGLVLLSPFIPLIFSGEESAETKSLNLMDSSKNESAMNSIEKPIDQKKYLQKFYQALIKLRFNHPALAIQTREHSIFYTDEKKNLLMIERHHHLEALLIICHFNALPTILNINIPEGQWNKILDANDAEFEENYPAISNIIDNGMTPLKLPPFCFVVYQRKK